MKRRTCNASNSQSSCGGVARGRPSLRQKLVPRLLAAAATTGALSIAVVHAGAGTSDTVTVAAAATAATPSATTTTTALSFAPSVCETLRAFLDDVRRISVSLTDPPNLQPALQRAISSLAESQDLSSHVSGPDIKVLRGVLADLKSGLDAAGYDFAKLPPATASALMSPQFTATFGRLQALVSGAC